jgi:hypothetical protein
MKNSERVAPRQSVERNLNSRRVRREFSRYPYHFSNGAISTVQNCAKSPHMASASTKPHIRQLRHQECPVLPLLADAVGAATEMGAQANCLALVLQHPVRVAGRLERIAQI